ncbi:peptidylprolyl isomerase [Candidatus Woesearchaeota archaeon]|nr:peptidylprolyl isomerase [Candidatus Woesearchaeota archaeon]
MAIKEGDFIKINYTGKINDSDKAVFDTTDIAVAKQEEIYSPKTKYGPAVIVVGEGQVLPGIDKQLIGKEPGTYTFEIPDVDAFGKKDAKLMKLLSNKIFVKEGIRPQPGLQVNIDNQMGFIRSVSGGRVVVDFNHPLASKDLIYDVEVIKIITDKKEQTQAFFDAMGLPVDKITATEKEVIITTKQLLPPEFAKPLTEDIKRLIKVDAVTFEATEGSNKKEEAKKEE